MIWIIGRMGMLGSSFVGLLEKRNISFIASSKTEADITSIESLRAFSNGKEISHIVNCSAYTKVDEAELESDLAFLVNTVGPANLAKIAKEIGAKVIHFSTDYVFSGSGHIPFDEESFCSPCNTYGRTKREGEKRLLEASSSSLVIRTSWLFGGDRKNFVLTMLNKMQKDQEISVVADQVGRPTFCQDLAEGVLGLLDCSGIFHLANQGQTSWYEFAQEIQMLALQFYPLVCRRLIPVKSFAYPSLAKRPSFSVLDTSKVEKLGVFLRPWKDALKRYLQEIRSNSCVS